MAEKENVLLKSVLDYLEENGITVKENGKTPQDPYYYKSHQSRKENSTLVVR
ncbi:hypothetical protein [Halobacillus amylolyticus]|uniref:Uncharacterized protein n=1 Tax=Halobacillus amylolyticus TaxID=2932259 RepID=A0ABY4HKQ4_9BACI|nr:hypothetical protein [Halobacillus amylolyticus]UOR14105.1 hypothetical protein MUO15_21355 [Halobacillus amylolyticus]